MPRSRARQVTTPLQPQALRDRVVNVASVPHRSPFRYPGGKTWLVPHTRRWLGSKETTPYEFAEPFAGGAIVGLSAIFENRAERLTLVELDSGVAAVWKTILGEDGPRLAARIASFEPSLESVRSLLSQPPKTTFDEAFATIVRNRVQHGGILAPGASFMKRGENGRGLQSRWYPETLKKRILAIVQMRERITFIHGDGMKFIEDNAEREDIVSFIDPPYTVAGRRLYAHSEIDHERLFSLASRLRGDFLMTYDNAEPVRLLAQEHGLDTREVPMKTTHHTVMTELLVGNDLCWLGRNITSPAASAVAR